MHKLQHLLLDSPDLFKILRQQILSWRQRGYLEHSHVVTFINPYSYLHLRTKQHLLSHIDSVYCDAISSARFSSFLLGKTIPRLSFDYGSVAKTFLTQMNKYRVPMFLLGSSPSILEQSKKNMLTDFPQLIFAGQQHGYFEDAQRQDIYKTVLNSGAQFVIIGMGTPLQEEIAVELVAYAKARGVNLHCFTCGGFLTQSGQKLAYYPDWINRYHLRWLWRLCKEQHVAKRLINEYPKYIGYFIKDRF